MKNILIIGGNRGVGLEIVNACLSLGYNVAFTGKESFEINKENEGNVIHGQFDLRNIKKCREFIDDVIARWRRIDGVVFYAGITPISSLLDCTEDLFGEIFDVNLKSTFFITQRVLRNMIENGGGSLVFFGTSHMDSGQANRAAYAISKGALKILSDHLARNYAKNQIRSNMIVMGWTPTEGELELRKSMGVTREELQEEASACIPMGRMLTVNDPVPAVMYFLSDDSCMVTGSTLRVNGGEYI